jgi:hypothetical protein
LKQIRKRLTYANVMSSIAVFLVIGGGAAIAADVLPPNSVGTPQLKKNAVKTGKVGPEAIKAGKLAKNAVATNRIRDNAVTAEKIPNGAIVTDKIGDAAVTSGKLAKDSVLTDKIADEAVTTGKIAKEAVLADKIANGAVTGGKIGAITVQTEKVTVLANSGGSANADCPAGQRAISGGGAWNTFNKELSFLSTRPIRSSADVGQMSDGQAPGGWRASGYNESALADAILVWVVCIE